MDRYCLIACLLVVPNALGAPALSYKGGIRLPMSLATTDGARLAKGQYDVEVKVQNGGYDLVFLQDEHALATVKGEVLKDDASDPPVAMPLIGTQYLRSSADPVGTEAERHSRRRRCGSTRVQTVNGRCSFSTSGEQASSGTGLCSSCSSRQASDVTRSLRRDPNPAANSCPHPARRGLPVLRSARTQDAVSPNKFLC